MKRVCANLRRETTHFTVISVIHYQKIGSCKKLESIDFAKEITHKAMTKTRFALLIWVVQKKEIMSYKWRSNQ